MYVTTYAKDFDIKLRYNVYANLGSYANFLALADKNGAGLIAGNADINKMRELNDFLNWWVKVSVIAYWPYDCFSTDSCTIAYRRIHNYWRS